jgi:tetratricopeptide (TPR) repeat protein
VVKRAGNGGVRMENHVDLELYKMKRLEPRGFKSSTIIFLAAVCMAAAFCVRGQESGSVSTNALSLKERMAAYESGKMTLEQLTEKAEWDDELLAFYRNHNDEVPVKWKLPISRCIAGFGNLPEAIEVAKQYLGVYSNDARGWRIVGVAKLLEKSYDEAIGPLTNAIRLGDNYSYKPLAMAAVALTRTNLLRDTVVPHLLETKDAKGTSTDEKLDLALILVGYALEANDKEVFVQ